MRTPKEFVYSQKVALEFMDNMDSEDVERMKSTMRRKMGEQILLTIEEAGKSAAWIEGVKWTIRKEDISGFPIETIELRAKVETEYT